MGFPGQLGAGAGDIVPPGHPPHKQPGISLPGPPPPPMVGLSRHMGPGPWSHSVGHTHKHTPLSSRWASGQGEAVSQNLPLTPIPKRFAHKMAERPAWLGWESACTPRARAQRTQAHALSDTTHDTHVHRGQPEATGPDPGPGAP